MVGGAGGSAIVSGIAGIAMHVLSAKEDVKRAVDTPRLHNQLQREFRFYSLLRTAMFSERDTV